MSIASRITAMQEHLRDDYDVLDLAGADLTNVNKNILNLKPTWKERLLYFMNNGTQQVWDNWEKVNGTGTTLTLNNTEEAPMSLVYKGNTLQNGTPTPDSPVPIQVVSGDNSIVVCGKNLAKPSFDKPWGISGSGNARIVTTNSSYYNRSEIVKVKSNTTYTISGDFSMMSTNYIRILSFDNEPQVGSTSTKYDYGASPFTFTTDTNTQYIMLYNSENVETIVNDIQLEEGSSKTSFEPYTGESYPISLGVENLFDFSNTTISTLGTVGTTTVQDNKVIFTANGSAYGVQFDIKNLVEKNTTYTISNLMSSTQTLTGNGNGWRYYDGSSYTTMGGYQTQFTFTTGNSTTHALYYYVGSPAPYNGTLTLSNIQLELGSKANSYTPYGTTPIELLKIGTYQDKIFKNTPNTTDYDSNLEDNVWYLKKEIGKYTFTGNETLATYGGGSSRKIVDLINAYSIANSDTPLGYNELSLMTPRINIFNSSGYGISYNSNEIYVRLADKVGQDLLDLLEGTSLYYILATPTYTLIEDTTLIEQLETIKKSYEGQTNISQENNDMPFILDITALSKE